MLTKSRFFYSNNNYWYNGMNSLYSGHNGAFVMHPFTMPTHQPFCCCTISIEHNTKLLCTKVAMVIANKFIGTFFKEPNHAANTN